jgi:hypothetical protein
MIRAAWAILATLAAGAAHAEEGCAHAIVARVMSPDRAWRADVDEARCGAGPYATDVTAQVRLAPAGRPGKPSVVLGVDNAGKKADRPRLEWTGPALLQVTVPNLSFLKIVTQQIGPVAVQVRFDPPDPAARAAWLKQHGL